MLSHRARAVAAAVVSVLALLASLSVAQPCTLPSCCNTTMRNSVNSATGQAFCIKVGVIADQGESARFFANVVPFTIWNETVRSRMFPGVAQPPIFINQTALGYDAGVDALRSGDFDVLIADTWALTRRAAGVEWSVAYATEALTLGFSARTRAEPQISSIFAPLQGEVWVAAIAFLAFAGLMLFMVEWVHPFSDDVPGRDGRLVYRYAFLRSIVRCLDNAFMAPFSEGRHSPKAFPGMLIMVATKWFWLVVAAAYVASLTSSLTVSGAISRVTLSGLLAQRVLGPPAGDAVIDFAVVSGAKVTPMAGPEYVSFRALRTAQDQQRADGSGAVDGFFGSYVAGENVVLDDVDRNCDARFMRLPVSVGTAISFRQHAAVTRARRAADATILAMRQSGAMEQLLARGNLNESQRCPNSRVQADEHPDSALNLRLGTNNMQGLFIVAIIFFLSAIVIAAVLRLLANWAWGTEVAAQRWEAACPAMTRISEQPNGAEFSEDDIARWRAKALASIAEVDPDARSTRQGGRRRSVTL
jgi:hypothetical protein